MLGCKPNDTLIKARNRMESDGKPVDREKYQRLVSRLIYLSHTRLDIDVDVREKAFQLEGLHVKRETREREGREWENFFIPKFFHAYK